MTITIKNTHTIKSPNKTNPTVPNNDMATIAINVNNTAMIVNIVNDIIIISSPFIIAVV